MVSHLANIRDHISRLSGAAGINDADAFAATAAAFLPALTRRASGSNGSALKHPHCRAGRLPAVSLITPEVFTDEGEYEDDQLGEAATASLFESIAASRHGRG